MRTLQDIIFILITIPLLLLLLPVPSYCITPSLNEDVLGLIVFKSNIHNDPYNKLTSWNEDDDSPCKWAGVKCNTKSNRVSELVLDGFSLSGRLSKGLLQLHFIEKLSLSGNNFTGMLTLGLAQLPELRVLDLSGNGLSGEIGDVFFRQCGSLRVVNLGGNRFYGPVPGSLGSCLSLVYVDLSRNEFSGVLPDGIWSLHGLRVLDLSYNVLEGEIGDGIGGMVSLRGVNLGGNRFSGKVPDGIGKCLLLRSIDLSGNMFVGVVPSTMQRLSLCSSLVLFGNEFRGNVPDWIGEMRSLERLDLSGNRFSGGVPESFGKLRLLKVLNVSKNELTGSLPVSMSGCVNLVTFDVSRNLLTGGVPEWLFKLGLEQVLLSGNQLNGSIDNALSSSKEGSRKKLVTLDVSQNKLTGEIPFGIGDFVSLQFLSMARNEFMGSIPSNIGKLKSLSVLDLSENRLNGSIASELDIVSSLDDLRVLENVPLSIGDCTSLKFLSLAHNSLTGSIPASLAKLTHLEAVDFSYNELTGTLPKQLANLVHLHSFNISHNRLQGELPSGIFFNTITPSSLFGNPSLCGAAVNKTCPTVLPKPLVLNPNSTDATPGPIVPQTFGDHGKKILSISALIAIGAAGAIVIGVVAITVLNLRVRSSTTSSSAVALTLSNGDGYSYSSSAASDSGKLVMFSGDPEFSAGTHALLNKDCELGRGGFGAVYKTMLKDGRSVAIKKLTVSSLVKSQEDFEREVKKLAKTRHVNVVGLDGYYWTPSLQLLIYEYVSGGSLYRRLHEEGSHLSWNERFNIVLGAARGLRHLHQMNIIHYNLKSSNILMDSSGEPKVGDYGLAQLLSMLDRYALSSKIQSALGYMAPEFACKTVKITKKCDVYGFGVLALEIVTGKRPVEYMEDDVAVLSDMVRGALEQGKVEECVDVRLQGKFPSEEAIPIMKLGLICTSQVPSNRPDMAEVVKILEMIRCPSGGSQDELGDFSS